MLLLIPVLLWSACTPQAADPGPKTKHDDQSDTDPTHVGDTDDTTDTQGEGDTAPAVEIHGEASVVLGTDNPHMAVVTVTVDHEATVWVEVGETLPGDQGTPTQVVPAGVPTEILVLGLKAGLDWSLVVHAEADGGAWDGEPMEVTTAPLIAGFQRCSATNFEDRHSPDEVYCTNGTADGGVKTYFCVNQDGDVVYQVAGAPARPRTRPAIDADILSGTAVPDRVVGADRRGAADRARTADRDRSARRGWGCVGEARGCLPDVANGSHGA